MNFVCRIFLWVLVLFGVGIDSRYSLSSAVQSNASLLEVFLIPHSHCDAGWLLTYEGYYDAFVNNILDSVVDELVVHPEYRFNWAETLWLSMWWEKQTEERRNTFTRLVNERKIDFIGGGWVMNDEPIAIFNDVIDQVTVGHEWLREHFGNRGRVRHGWQIDMFSGYSSVTPSLWALMGYDATVVRFEGVDEVRAEWNRTKGYEFVWQGSQNLPQRASEIFTHCIQHNYGSMMGNYPKFDFENLGSQPINETNVANRSQDLVDLLMNLSICNRGPYMAVWGSDFRFHNASLQFENMTKLVNYINHHPELGIHIRYSTVSEYFDYLHSLDLTWPRYRDVDFEVGWPHEIPIYNNTIQYQTGALTSRAYFKGLIRHTNSILRPAEMTYSLARSSVTPTYWNKMNGTGLFQNLLTSRQARAVVQHHDSLAGTMQSLDCQSPQPVLQGYESHLYEARNLSFATYVQMMQILAAKDENSKQPQLTFDVQKAFSQLDNNHPIAVLVFNSLGWTNFDPIEIFGVPSSLKLQVFDDSGNVIPSQVVSSLEKSQSLIIFPSNGVPPAGFATFFVQIQSSSNHQQQRSFMQTKKSDYLSFENLFFQLTFDSGSGSLLQVKNKQSGVSINIKQQFLEYQNGTGGAYILVENDEAKPLSDPIPKIEITNGPYVYQLKQTFSSGLEQITRLYSVPNNSSLAQQFVDVLQHVGPEGDPRELISRYYTDLSTGGTFVIDYSGLEMHTRKFDPTIPGNVIGGNYHSMVSCSYIQSQNEDRRFTILSGQSAGVTSLNEGELEVMLLRRTNSSDQQGPYPLNDTTTLNLHFRLLVDNKVNSEAVRRNINLMQQFPLIPLFGVSEGWKSWSSQFRTKLAPLTKDLPSNIHLLNLQPRNSNSNEGDILRLLHLFERGDHPIYSRNTTINLATLFAAPWTLNSAVEKTLSLQWDLSELHRQQWRTSNFRDEEDVEPQTFPLNNKAPDTVTLSPIQMRTFQLNF